MYNLTDYKKNMVSKRTNNAPPKAINSSSDDDFPSPDPDAIESSFNEDSSATDPHDTDDDIADTVKMNRRKSARDGIAKRKAATDPPSPPKKKPRHGTDEKKKDSLSHSFAAFLKDVKKKDVEKCIFFPDISLKGVNTFHHPLLDAKGKVLSLVAGNERAFQYDDHDKVGRRKLMGEIMGEVTGTYGVIGTVDVKKHGKDKWSWSLQKDLPALRDKIMARLRQNYSVKNRGNPNREKQVDKTDKGLGMDIIEALGYGESPWTSGVGQVKTLSDDEVVTRKKAGEAGATHFGGNFSLIAPLGRPLKLGIAHCSHRAWECDQAHLGSVTLVEVPEDCLILFHAILFHYGNHAEWGDYGFHSNPRMFAYFRDKTHLQGSQPVTFHADPKLWCDKNCCRCRPVAEKLMAKRCGGEDEMVWRCNKSPHAISKLEAGTHLMGDIDSLGWVVLKGHVHGDNSILEFSQEIVSIVQDFQETPTNFFEIQGAQDKMMQFPHLRKEGPHELFFNLFPGKRYMMYNSIEEKNMHMQKRFPKLHEVFKKNTRICATYLFQVTTIRCQYVSAAPNVLLTYLGVREQYMHTDYDPKVTNN